MITDRTIYKYFHKHCPKCDGIHIIQTCAATGHDADGYLIDKNKAHCQTCGWVGIVHDLLPKDKDLGPISEGHVCKHDIRWPHECRFCEDYIYGLMTGKFPLL